MQTVSISILYPFWYLVSWVWVWRSIRSVGENEQNKACLKYICQFSLGTGYVKTIFIILLTISFYQLILMCLACKCRRISGCRLSPPKNNVCELEPENDFRDVKILSQLELGSENPRTATRVTCESIARLHGENNGGRSGHGARGS